MTTLSFGTYRNQDVKTPGFVSRAITRIGEAWKNAQRYDQASQQNKTFIEQNLIDPNVGPEIARTLR